MQRSTQRVNITDWFLEHHVFFFLLVRKYNWLVPGTSCFCFIFGAYPFFARTLLQGKSQCKALNGINEKTNKQQQQQQQQPNYGLTMAGRESSLEPILLAEWICACSLLHLWLSSVTLAFFIVEFLLKISHRLDRFT